MRFAVTHRTHYRYDQQVNASFSEARLVPRSLPYQTCHRSTVQVEPAPGDQRERLDYFGNHVLFLSVDDPHTELTVTATSDVEVHERPRPDAWGSQPWERARDALRDPDRPELFEARQYVLDSPLVAVSAAVRSYAEDSFAPGRPLIDALDDLAARIHRDIDYKAGVTHIATRVGEVLDRRHGVCQDFAHLAIACVRAMGLPARYVSGYLETDPPEGADRLVGADASHAWLSVLAPDEGWVDFDPTNDQRPAERHLVIGWGRDFADVTPLKGVVFTDGAHHELTVEVDVTRT